MSNRRKVASSNNMRLAKLNSTAPIIDRVLAAERKVKELTIRAERAEARVAELEAEKDDEEKSA